MEGCGVMHLDTTGERREQGQTATETNSSMQLAVTAAAARATKKAEE